MLALIVAIQARLVCALARRDQRGQAVAEYALVLLGAAAVALVVGRWVSKTAIIGRLLDAVFDSLLDRIT
ncbi:MAG: hypothetical protein M3394_10120 [Actinomycetota bacterium]|nr:hypothetical protein [Actinomycetota bacterium]